MKKIFALLLALVLVLGMVACAAETEPAATPDAAETPAKTEQPAATAEDEDVYNVIMQIVTFGQEFSGITAVEEAINAISVPEIGVSVTLVPIAGWDLATTSSLEITSGNKLDLMCVLAMGSGLDNIGNYAGKNMLTPLDELYDTYGQDIDSCIGELKQLGYYGGTLYGVPVNYLAGVGGGYVVRTDLMNELGFNFEEGKLYTLEDLEPMFAAYKEKYGNGHYVIAAYDQADPMQAIVTVDMIGDGSTGAMMNAGIDNMEIVNVFETDAYADYTNTARAWYQAGYFNPDVATITDSWTQLIATGTYLGAFTTFNGSDGLDGKPSWENSSGYELTAIKIAEDAATTQIASYAIWTIPVTCENPEKTMQFLNLLYQDRELGDDIDSLLAAGIEGETYQILESVGGSKAIIAYADGVDYMSSPFEQTVPIYGNQFTVPKMAPLTADIYDKFISYNKDLADAGRYSQAFGYVFDATSVSAEKAAVQNVITQYRPLLAFGVVDPAEVLPEFQQALKDAGIDTVIAENQRQLDEWAALKK